MLCWGSIVKAVPVDQNVIDSPDTVDLFGGLEENEEKADLSGNDKILGSDTVDKSQTEGTVIYDIIFLAKAPNGDGLIQLIVNIEVQNDAKLVYWVVTRGEYYCARMISAQKNRVFSGSDYQKIRKVYSIWICPYAKNGENTITSFDMEKHEIYGHVDVPKSEYDKQEVIVITLNAEGLKSENDLIKFLSLLLNNEMPVEQREKTLQADYHLQMTEELREDVNNVCNYSDAMIMIGEQRGEQRGEQQEQDNMFARIQKLTEAGRIGDLEKCNKDKNYLNKLFAEFGIKTEASLVPAQ